MEGAKEWEFVLQGGICGMEDNVELGLIKKRGKEQRLGGTQRCLKGLEEVKTSGSGRIDRDQKQLKLLRGTGRGREEVGLAGTTQLKWKQLPFNELTQSHWQTGPVNTEQGHCEGMRFVSKQETVTFRVLLTVPCRILLLPLALALLLH